MNLLLQSRNRAEKGSWPTSEHQRVGSSDSNSGSLLLRPSEKETAVLAAPGGSLLGSAPFPHGLLAAWGLAVMMSFMVPTSCWEVVLNSFLSKLALLEIEWVTASNYSLSSFACVLWCHSEAQKKNISMGAECQQSAVNGSKPHGAECMLIRWVWGVSQRGRGAGFIPGARRRRLLLATAAGCSGRPPAWVPRLGQTPCPQSITNPWGTLLSFAEPKAAQCCPCRPLQSFTRFGKRTFISSGVSEAGKQEQVFLGAEPRSLPRSRRTIDF